MDLLKNLRIYKTKIQNQIKSDKSLKGCTLSLILPLAKAFEDKLNRAEIGMLVIGILITSRIT
jgi:hypothetical protein